MKFEKILDIISEQKNISFAIFNAEQELIFYPSSLNTFLSDRNIQKHFILTELLPEFIGFEDGIASLITENNDKIVLEKINLIDKRKDIHYYDFMLFPIKDENNILFVISDDTELSILLQNIQQQKNDLRILQEKLDFYRRDSIKGLWGASSEINKVKSFIDKVSNLENTPLLLTGESGTGKTLVANIIHNASALSGKSFTEINCATIPSNLVESELFGHVKGSFTGAQENKKGLLEEADGGTLFLDEIGDLPLSVQPKFLSFLETKSFRKVGSTKEIKVDVRIITATNKDLEDAVKEKEFREDLYYRINVVSLKIPALRERKTDIVTIAENYLKFFSRENNKNIGVFSSNAKHKLINYSWPGNIRELKNIIERAVIFCENNIIEDYDLEISSGKINQDHSKGISIPENGISLEDIEIEYLKKALERAGGNQTKAAKLLNLSLDTLRYRIKKFNLSE